MKANRLILSLLFSMVATSIWSQSPVNETEEDSVFSNLVLDEIVVSVARPLQKISKGGIVFNVEHTALSKSGSLTDMLERIPSISRNKDGYEVVGKGKPIVYIDGRKIHDISEMETLRSEQIADVEVVTNPGPEYDAQTLAVIKIRTIKSKDSGMGLDGVISYSGPAHNDYSAQLNTNYLTDKFEIYESAKYSFNDEMESHHIQQTADIGKMIAHKSHYKSEYSTQHFDNNMSAIFKVLPEQQIGVNYNLSAALACDYNLTMLTDLYENGMITDELTNRVGLHRFPSISHKLNAYYAGKLGGWNARVDYDFIHSREGQSQMNNQYSEMYEEKFIRADNKSKATIHTIRSDFSGSLGKGIATAGLEFVMTRRNDCYRNTDTFIGSSDGLLKEKMIAGFTSYLLPTKIGEFTAGLRYEHSTFRYIDNEYVTHKKFNNIFPSANWQKRFGLLHLSVNYTSKIQRPRYRDLSNEIIYVNSFCLSTGNPLLKNAIHHEVALMAKWSTLTFYSSFRNTSNAIVYWGESYKGNNAITLLKMENVPHLAKSITSIAWAPVFGRFAPVISSSYVKQWLSIGENKFNRPIFTASATNTLNCGKGWTAMVDLRYRSRGNTENAFLNDNIFNISASLRKSFLNEKCVVEFKVSDILNDCADNSTLYFPNRTMSQKTKWDSRSGTITIRYHFHDTKRKVNTIKSGDYIDRL